MFGFRLKLSSRPTVTYGGGSGSPITHTANGSVGTWMHIDLVELVPTLSLFTIDAGSLPAGLTFDAAVGEIYGVPSVEATTVLTIGAGTETISLTIVVAAGTLYETVTPNGAYFNTNTDLGGGSTNKLTIAFRGMMPVGHATAVTIFAVDTGSATGTTLKFNNLGQINLVLRNTTANGTVTNGSKFSAAGVNYFDGLVHNFVVEADISGIDGTRYIKMWVDGNPITLTNNAEPGADVIDIDGTSGYSILSNRNLSSEFYPSAGTLEWIYVNFGEAFPGTSFTSTNAATVGTPQIFFGGALSKWNTGDNDGSAGGTWSVAGGTFTGSGGGGDPTPKAFYNAVGFGRFATGGRGKTVYRVTNTSSGTGAGSIGAALAAASAGGYIIVEAEGAVELTDWVRIQNPDITIDARRAPGLGFWLERSGVWVNASNIILRGIRVYPGSSFDGPAAQGRDCFRVDSTVAQTDIYIDQCDALFAPDETLSLYPFSGAQSLERVTIANSLVAESLYDNLHIDETADLDRHGMGLITNTGASKLTIYGCVFASHNDRLPLNRATSVEMVSNIFTNFNQNSVYTDSTATMDWINNAWLLSPSSNVDTADKWRRVGTTDANVQVVYVSGEFTGSWTSDGFVDDDLTGGWRIGNDWSGVGTDLANTSNSTLFTKSGVATGALSYSDAFFSIGTRVGAKNPQGHRHPHAERVVRYITEDQPFSNGWYGTNYEANMVPDEVRAIGTYISSPQSGTLRVALPNATVGMPIPASRTWASVTVDILDAYTRQLILGDDPLPRNSKTWSSDAISKAGTLTASNVDFSGLAAGFYIVRLTYTTTNGVSVKLYSAWPVEVIDDYLSEINTSETTDRVSFYDTNTILVTIPTDVVIAEGLLKADEDPVPAGHVRVYLNNEGTQPALQQLPTVSLRSGFSGKVPAINAATTGSESIFSTSQWSVDGVNPSAVYVYSSLGDVRRTDTQTLRGRRWRVALQMGSATASTVAITPPWGGTLNGNKATAESDFIGVSTIGYEALGQKRATATFWNGTNTAGTVLEESDLASAPTWELKDTNSGDIVLSGTAVKETSSFGGTASVAPVWVADFSAVTKPGRYRIEFSRFGRSKPFHIRPGVARDVARMSLQSLVYLRRDQLMDSTWGAIWGANAGFGQALPAMSQDHQLTDVRFLDTDEAPGGDSSGLATDKYESLLNSFVITDVTKGTETIITMKENQSWVSGDALWFYSTVTGGVFEAELYNRTWRVEPVTSKTFRLHDNTVNPIGVGTRVNSSAWVGTYETSTDPGRVSNNVSIIANITKAASGSITMAVAPGWTSGQRVRLQTSDLDGQLPEAWLRTFRVEPISAVSFRLHDDTATPIGVGTRINTSAWTGTYNTSTRPGRAGLAFKVRKGHRDAADYDIRPQHLGTARVFVLLAALSQKARNIKVRQPEGETDWTVTVRERGISEVTRTVPGGLPDVVIEAMHTADAYRHLQESDGGVRAGAEGSRYMTAGGTAWAQRIDAVNSVYATCPYASYEAAATWATLAWVLPLLLPSSANLTALVNEYAAAAQLAYDWAEANKTRSDFVSKKDEPRIRNAMYSARAALFALNGGTALENDLLNGISGESSTIGIRNINVDQVPTAVVGYLAADKLGVRAATAEAEIGGRVVKRIGAITLGEFFAQPRLTSPAQTGSYDQSLGSPYFTSQFLWLGYFFDDKFDSWVAASGCTSGEVTTARGRYTLAERDLFWSGGVNPLGINLWQGLAYGPRDCVGTSLGINAGFGATPHIRQFGGASNSLAPSDHSTRGGWPTDWTALPIELRHSDSGATPTTAEYTIFSTMERDFIAGIVLDEMKGPA
jgi:Cellulase N-terminal ig-like domain